MKSADLLAPPSKSVASRLGRLRFSVAQLLVVLVVLIVTHPLVEQLQYGDVIEDALFTILMLSAVLAIGAGRRTFVWAIVLVVPALFGQWSDGTWLEQYVPGLGGFGALVFLMFVVFHLLRFVLRAPQVNSEVLFAGIVAYLLLGILWGFAYALVEIFVPGSFAYTPNAAAAQAMRGFNAFYFSFITLSTVGFGDFVPVLPLARTLAISEAMTGTLYLAILISRLVSLHLASGPRTRS